MFVSVYFLLSGLSSCHYCEKVFWKGIFTNIDRSRYIIPHKNVMWTNLGLKSGDLLLHIFLTLLLFLQHLPQAVLLFLHLPQAGREGKLLTSLLFKQLLRLRKRKQSGNLTNIYFLNTGSGHWSGFLIFEIWRPTSNIHQSSICVCTCVSCSWDSVEERSLLDLMLLTSAWLRRLFTLSSST